MDYNLILAFVATALAAAVGAYLLIRLLVGAKRNLDDNRREGGSSVRALLAIPGAFVLRRRANDRELAKKLDEYERLITQSGGKFLDGASAPEIFAARYIFPAIAVLFIALIGLILRLPGGPVLMMAAFFGALLFMWPESGLRGLAKERTSAFVRELPLALDVMKLVTQSGGDLQSAIQSVISVTKSGPVREELVRCIGEVTIGTSLVAALNNIAARIGTSEANAVFSTLAQSIEMGTSVSENVGSAAALIRHQARIRAQEKAQKAVVAMSFPLLLLILPGVFIVLFAPLVIQFMNR